MLRASDICPLFHGRDTLAFLTSLNCHCFLIISHTLLLHNTLTFKHNTVKCKGKPTSNRRTPRRHSVLPQHSRRITRASLRHTRSSRNQRGISIYYWRYLQHNLQNFYASHELFYFLNISNVMIFFFFLHCAEVYRAKFVLKVNE